MLKYKFKYKKNKNIFWKTKLVIGHSLEFIDETIIQNNNIVQKTKKSTNAMILYFEDGSIERIGEWSKYDMRLGVDWKIALTDQMEKEAGTQIKTNI